MEGNTLDSYSALAYGLGLRAALDSSGCENGLQSYGQMVINQSK